MKAILTTVFCCFTLLLVGQESKWPSIDKSPMDASMYPSSVAFRNYRQGDERTASPIAKVVYSRPSVNGRSIFGGLIPFGKEWRVGANEATTVTFYQDVDINGNHLRRGTYTISATPTATDWTVNFSTQSGIWGSENRDKSLDVASVTVPTQKLSTPSEALTMVFQKVDDHNFNYVIQWADTRVAVPVNLNPVIASRLDVSPMDQAVYPAKAAYTNYLKGEEAKLTPKIAVLYSRPYKKGRDIFGKMLKQGDVWRIGANESTEISLYQDVEVAGKALKAGKYVLYAKLNNNSWDLIFSKDFPAWGSANRDASKDVLTVPVTLSSESEVLENLSIIFEEAGANTVNMVIGWDTTRATVPFMMK